MSLTKIIRGNLVILRDTDKKDQSIVVQEPAVNCGDLYYIKAKANTGSVN